MKTEQNAIYANLGLYYSARGYFHVKCFWQQCYTIAVDMILIHLIQIFARVWALTWPKEGLKPIFPYFALLSQDLQKLFLGK